MRESWIPNRTAIYRPPLLWPSALCLSRSPGLLNRRPGGPLSAGCWLPLPHLVTKGSALQTNWLPVFTELYNSSIAHSISLEWHIWSSSSGNNCHAVHRSLSYGASVYDYTMWFYLVPYCQPSPPMRFLPITAIWMCHFPPVHHFRMACLAGSKVNIQHMYIYIYIYIYIERERERERISVCVCNLGGKWKNRTIKSLHQMMTLGSGMVSGPKYHYHYPTAPQQCLKTPPDFVRLLWHYGIARSTLM